ncbi:calycin-like domain-containing protein [Leyella stercorea]|uniref:calycin-like domain-containing protein n=1 Tax=Leyella stercorea TaxID=363265 RepID=UPI003AF6EA2F
MKKILSLLVLLVTTLSAFALDFTDYRKVTLGSNTPTESNDAKLSVTDNGDGTYNVTFNDIININKDGSYTDNYGTFTFSNVSGSKSGDVTTVTATDVTGTVSGGYGITEFTKGNLSLKFKDGKAYATMAATCTVWGRDYIFDVVFGTDEGFGGGSTGGGETGGETSLIVTVKENFQSTEGSSWGENVTIDWNTQKLVASINLANTGSDKGFLGVTKKGEIAGWNNYGIIFYNTNGSTVQGYAPGQPNNANTNQVTKGEDPVRFEISKDGGVKCQGNVVISAYNIAHLTNQSEIVVGAADKPAGALYNYIKVVSLDWKEPTEPEVTVKDEKTFNEALYMQDQKVADAKVVVKEMSDETINMSLKFGENEYTSTELTKGTDTKGRTTYTGKVANGDQTYDVAGVVYEKDNVARLYMTLTTSITTVVVGENPDVVTPEVTEVSNKTYTSNLRIFDGEEPVVENAEAQVNIIKYSDESYKVTLKEVNILNKTQDLVFVGKAIVEEVPTEGVQPLTIMAKSDEATTTVFGEQVSGTFEITEVSADEIKMGFSMESQNFSYQGEFNYTEEEEPEVYTNNLHIYDAAAPETDLFQADQAKVEFLATETGEFKLTLKDVTLNEKTQDLVFTGALPTPQPGGQDPLAEEGEGEVTPAEPAMVLNATADEATATFLGTTSATAVFNVIMNDEAETENDAFALTFTITAGEKTLGGEFNYKKKTPDTPDPELFCKENYVADGEGFEWDINVDWDTQKIVMSIDPSTCTGSCEDVIGLGAVPTAWDNTLHLYRTSADQQLQGYFQTSAGNNNTGKFAETAPFLVEVSKAQGFVVNNEVKIASSAMSYLFTLSTVKMGTGEGANDKSRATYNYVKVVDKDWTAPKDPDTGINATTVAEGEVEFFTVNGVKLNKLQKGLNIVRTADGKVKKVLVK